MERCKNDFVEVCRKSLERDIDEKNELTLEKNVYISLNKSQIVELSEKINLLPIEYQSILFARYYFACGPNESEKILSVKNIKGKLYYIEEMLAHFMGLQNELIDRESILEACNISMNNSMEEYEDIKIIGQPNYSKNFKNKLRGIDIKLNNKKIDFLSTRKIAVFILIGLISISTFLTTNARVREQVFKWIISRFSKFSIITSKNMGLEEKTEEKFPFLINYVPEGFNLTYVNEGEKMFIYNYLSNKEQTLTIKFIISSDKGRSYYDTEGADVEEIEFKGYKAYIWETDSLTYLIFNDVDLEVHISGSLSRDEILKIGKNISK